MSSFRSGATGTDSGPSAFNSLALPSSLLHWRPRMHSLLSGLWSLLTSALSSRKERESGSVLPSSASASSPASFTSPRSISETGLAVLKHYEGCKLKAYRDSVGVLTIGWGETENVTEGMTITQDEARRPSRTQTGPGL